MNKLLVITALVIGILMLTACDNNVNNGQPQWATIGGICTEIKSVTVNNQGVAIVTLFVIPYVSLSDFSSKKGR